MQFRSKLLQRPAPEPETTLSKIYDVYLTPEGDIEGESDELGEVLDIHSQVVPERPERRMR